MEGRNGAVRERANDSVAQALLPVWVLRLSPNWQPARATYQTAQQGVAVLLEFPQTVKPQACGWPVLEVSQGKGLCSD